VEVIAASAVRACQGSCGQSSFPPKDRQEDVVQAVIALVAVASAFSLAALSVPATAVAAARTHSAGKSGSAVGGAGSVQWIGDAG
jgi:hypothetical protein